MLLKGTIMDNTTIIVAKSTRQLLRTIGHKGDTYNDIILNLIQTESRKSQAEVAAVNL